ALLDVTQQFGRVGGGRHQDSSAKRKPPAQEWARRDKRNSIKELAGGRAAIFLALHAQLVSCVLAMPGV
ncbi:MAG: hypothetical protein KA132_09720, partial [Thauera sp.]|nr:hypothetical protein [Thauera sp.]